MTNNDGNVNVEIEKSIVNKVIALNSTYLEIILQYITLTDYYL